MCRQATRAAQGTLICTHTCATQADCHDFPDCYVCEGSGGSEKLCQKDMTSCVVP